MSRKIAVSLALCGAAFLAGCATSSSKSVKGPSGGQAYIVQCASARIDSCYEEAAKVCPAGYRIADRGDNPNGSFVPVGGMLMAVRGPSTMLVECKS